MSLRINKEWINEDNFDTDAYRDGVFEFMTFVQKNLKGDRHSCPCRRCRNGTGHINVDDIFVHLMKDGMDKNYIVWRFHGETMLVNPVRQAPQPVISNETTDHIDESDFPKLDDLVNDACEIFIRESGPSNPSCDEGGEGNTTFTVPDDSQTHKGKKYEHLQQLAREPLHPLTGASRHTTMYALVKLNDLKTQYSLSDGATGGILGLLNELLPEGNNLTTSYSEMKNTIRDVGMNYVKYDVCINNCILFWKEHEHSQECPKCGAKRYRLSSRDDNGEKFIDAGGRIKFRKVAMKVMRHFPLIPRLKRLYTIKWIADKMTWHYRAKSCGEFLRHPRDSSDWANANILWKAFAKEPRNVRLAIATDGFNPNSMFGRNYSCWPVIIQPLNLPPSLCMKSEFSMLTVLIPGPRSPKSSIDVFLQPLVDELKILWSGVEAWDANKKEPFQLKAMLMWGIHDFPAYGMLSGCAWQGHYACPICSNKTPSKSLPISKKCCYQRSRMFLPQGHRYRFDTSRKTFNGETEEARAPRKLTGIEVEQIQTTIERQSVEEKGKGQRKTKGKGKVLTKGKGKVLKGKGKRKLPVFIDEADDDWPIDSVDEDLTGLEGFSRRSILFDLEYWKYHDIRHNLDIMHVEKNVTETLLGTILSVKGPSNKDTVKAREELQKYLNLKKSLWMQECEDSDKRQMPQAPFSLCKEDKLTFYRTLKSLKLPIGFSSNFNNNVSLDPPGFVNLKSHDYHTIMQHLLPMLLMHSFPDHKPLFKAIQRISIFFNVVCAKVIFRDHLIKAKLALTEALCALEIYFPPSFFVIMIHLMHHLADEALAAGPPRFRAMWLFERNMKDYKKWSRNKRYIEGSIANAYLLHEASLYAMEYVSKKGEGTHKRNLEAYLDDEFDDSTSQQALSKGKTLILNNVQYEQARRWVLFQYEGVDEWRSKFESTVGIQQRTTSMHRVDDFIPWLRVEASRANKDMGILPYVSGPLHTVTSYTKFRSNGYTFSTLAHEENRNVQSSGVSMKAFNKDGIFTTFYGVIRQILDLNYNSFTHTVFYCDWVNMDAKNAYKVDPTSKLEMVNLSKLMSKNSIQDEPFILASQASQVFYCNDTKFDGWSVVLHAPKRLTKSIDALEIDRTMYNSILEENEKLCELLDSEFV